MSDAVPAPNLSVLEGIVGFPILVFSALLGSFRRCLELAGAGSSIGFKFISRLCKGGGRVFEQAYVYTYAAKPTFPCLLQQPQHLPYFCQHISGGLGALPQPSSLGHFAAAGAVRQ